MTGCNVNGISQIWMGSVNLITQLQTVFFDFILEGAAADAKEFSCFCSVLIGFI
jgi:hypothetical protein